MPDLVLPAVVGAIVFLRIVAIGTLGAYTSSTLTLSAAIKGVQEALAS